MTDEVRKLVNHAIKGDTTEFQDTFHKIISTRTAERLDTMKKEIARDIFQNDVNNEGL